MTITRNQLAAEIRNLPETVPITAEFERVLTRRGVWNTNSVWYTSQKEHWLGWLKGYNGPGHYNRKDCHRSAEFVYNHIVCPPMVLFLGEASGVPKAKVAEARRAALSAEPHVPTKSAAIRRIIPWELIEVCLDKRGRRPIATATKTSTKQGAGLERPSSRVAKWAWRKRGVGPWEDHFELRYGSAKDSGWDDWMPVARIGRPIDGVFGVDFIINHKTPNYKAMMDKTKDELDFYLVELHERDPWVYAKYHCGTTANIYSSIHWRFFSGKPNCQSRKRQR
jgi:hypothetical protein